MVAKCTAPRSGYAWAATILCLLVVFCFQTSVCEYCATNYDPDVGQSTCSVAKGCCLTSGQCAPCQRIRGFWQGLLGTCVYEPLEEPRADGASEELGGLTSGKCIPVNGPDGEPAMDPCIIIFSNSTGRMATTNEPGTTTGGGRGTTSSLNSATGPENFNFEFNFISDEETGEVDLKIDTFLGERLLFGRWEILVEEEGCSAEESSLCFQGVTLALSLGTGRPPSPSPAQDAGVIAMEARYVYFRGSLIQAYQTSPQNLPANRFLPGSCKYEVRQGDTLASIAAQYKVTWQELFAFNAQLVEPEEIQQGDVISVGRHHRVRGPCLTQCRRQADAFGATEIDYGCREDGQCLACDWAARPGLCGETLHGIATLYGTSWQRIVDMNPQLAENCAIVPGTTQTSCRLFPGDDICVVPYLRAVVCSQEYRRYPVVDNQGQSWDDLGRYFTCNTVWSTARLADKCCHLPRCRCCTTEGAAGGEATKNLCDPNIQPVTSCIRDPTDGLCDDDCGCVSGFIPLETLNVLTDEIETSCVERQQCRICKDNTQSPPGCTICASL